MKLLPPYNTSEWRTDRKKYLKLKKEIYWLRHQKASRELEALQRIELRLKREGEKVEV